MTLLFKDVEGIIAVIDKEYSWDVPVAYIHNVPEGLVLVTDPNCGLKSHFVLELVDIMEELESNPSLMSEIGSYS